MSIKVPKEIWNQIIEYTTPCPIKFSKFITVYDFDSLDNRYSTVCFQFKNIIRLEGPNKWGRSHGQDWKYIDIYLGGHEKEITLLEHQNKEAFAKFKAFIEFHKIK